MWTLHRPCLASLRLLEESGSISISETTGALCTVRVVCQAFRNNEALPVADKDMLCQVDPTQAQPGLSAFS